MRGMPLNVSTESNEKQAKGLPVGGFAAAIS